MVGSSELKAFSRSQIKPMTTNGLQLGPSERLSEYLFQAVLAKPSLSPSEVLNFIVLQEEVR